MEQEQRYQVDISVDEQIIEYEYIIVPGEVVLLINGEEFVADVPVIRPAYFAKRLLRKILSDNKV